ncbi:MAG: glycosyltransferase [Rikenellaceae bacterium]
MNQNKIRVLHFIPGFLYGGIESLFMMWFDKVDKCRYDFEILLRTKDQQIALLDQYNNLGGIHYRLAIFSPRYIFRYIKSVKKFFQDHHDYDIMHAHKGDPFVFYYAKKYGIKSIIYHSHTTAEGTEGYKLFKKLFRKVYDLFITQRVACSDLASQWLFPDHTDIVIIPNSVDVTLFKYDSEVRARYRKELNVESAKVIVSVGRLTYPKNHPFILDIIAELSKRESNTVLVIVGDGPDEPQIKELIKERSIEQRVIMLGRRSDVPQLLQAADLFLMPSHFEGLPVSIVESQAAGLPALLSDVITKQVQITDLVDYKSLNDSVHDWADQIETMLERGVDRKCYYNQVLSSDFNINNSIEKLERLYDNLLQR